MPVDDYLTSHPGMREIYERVAAVLAPLGPLVVDAVGVGILFKRSRTFAELRPRKVGAELSVLLNRVPRGPRIAKSLRLSANRYAVYVRLSDAAAIDDEVEALLTESYADSPS